MESGTLQVALWTITQTRSNAAAHESNQNDSAQLIIRFRRFVAKTVKFQVRLCVVVQHHMKLEETLYFGP